MFITMEHFIRGEVGHFDLYTGEKCNIILKVRRGRQQLSPACLDRPSQPAQHHRPYVHDAKDPPVSHHAPHAAASGQADRWAPSVSRLATGSSSSPRQPHLSTEPRPKQQTRARGHAHRMTLSPTLAPCPRNRPRTREPPDALSADQPFRHPPWMSMELGL